MKEQLPSPEFNTGQYLRANQKWVCGWASEGRACHIGPTADGRCRATFECQPLLEKKEGEAKGRYRCTRLKEFGGPCENGPQPDGTCGRPIPHCQPVRSLRTKRGLFTWSIITMTVGGLLLALYGPYRWTFISPRDVSSHHTGAAFAGLQVAGIGGDSGCAACHTAGQSGPAGWFRTALTNEPGLLQFRKLARVTKGHMTTIDLACIRCHAEHKFHQPNVVRDYSCSACHREHQGTGPMKQPESENCAACHADPAIMAASHEKGRTLPPQAFDYRKPHGRVQFKAARPAPGYTQVFATFSDHPEFQIIAQNLKEANTLRFNHQRHLADDIPAVNGKRLDCVDCHKADAAGTYHLKISFDANCRACHSLQFDAHNPDAQLAHGNATAARAFLHSLDTQYADLARRVKGLTSPSAIDEFVRQQLRKIREQYGSGEALEQHVFFNEKKWGPVGNVGGLGNQGRPLFAGCAYCHEVKAVSNDAPAVTKPVIPDRWLVRGEFNHAKHLNVACVSCHDVSHSTTTADILLPSQASCVKCHSPQGGVADSCATCHNYHVPDRRVISMQAAK